MASQYRQQINGNPFFRDRFNQLCDCLDVDPIVCKCHRRNHLNSARKNLFSDVGIGDFYN